MNVAASIASCLAETGVSITPDFIAPALVKSLRDDILRLEKSDQFRKAGVGEGRGHQVRESIRRDLTYWLDRTEANEVQTQLWAHIDEVKAAINEELFLGLYDFEGHYAIYDQGGFYERHRDAFRDTRKVGPSRLVSLVLYLNDDWQPPDGGELRIYQSHTQSDLRSETDLSKSPHVDVPPVGGTLVCFLSREVDHEVRPSHVRRLSFAGWLRG